MARTTNCSKRQRTAATSRSRAMKGQLKMLPEMPLDILFEIFGQLEPSDLMRLSRTTKALRNVLMTRSAISVWKSAFLNDPDLPAIPEGLTEPQYANLAFSQHCHYCFAPGEHDILWAFRVRCCQKCLDGRFDEVYKVAKKLSKNQVVQRSHHLLRRATVGGCRWVYSYEEAKELDKKLVELKKGDSTELEKYIEERSKLVEAIQTHASQAERSGALRLARKERMLQEARDRRKNAVCRHLDAIGYSEEVQFLKESFPEALTEHPLIKSEEVLTDKAWSEMEPVLVPLMVKARQKLERKKRKALLKNRQNFLISAIKGFMRERPVDEVHPQAVDLCVLPRFKAIIEDPSPATYSTEDDFQDLMKDLPNLCDDWRNTKTLELLALIPGPPRDHAFLLLATSFFRCGECSEPLGYPRVLAHSCLFTLRHGHRNREDDIALLCQELNAEPWNTGGQRVAWYPAAEVSAQAVVRACGLNTEMTTAQDMDDVGMWLECLPCAHKQRGRAVFRWRKAVLHDLYHALSGTTCTWRQLSDADTDAAEALQEKTYAMSYGLDAALYSCVHCREALSYARVGGHMRLSHNIDNAERDEDFVSHVDASMDQPPFSILLPPSVPEVPDGPSWIEID